MAAYNITKADSATVLDGRTVTSAPSVSLVSPSRVDSAPDSPIVLAIRNGGGSHVDETSLVATVAGVTVYSGEAGQAGWSGHLSYPGLPLSTDGVRTLSLFAPEGFAYLAVVPVTLSLTYTTISGSSSSTHTFSFTVEADPSYWTGALSSFELRLVQPFTSYALEQLRVRFLYAVTTNHDATRGARTTAQLAFETEIGVAIAKMVKLPPEVATSRVSTRRRYTEIDADMAQFRFLVGAGLNAARALAFMPSSYFDLFQTHLSSSYARYRVCAIAAFLCAAAWYLTPAQATLYAQLVNDAVTVTDTYSVVHS